jgi:hypothetical protein
LSLEKYFLPLEKYFWVSGRVFFGCWKSIFGY